VRSPCCSELEHTSNFAEPDFLKTIIADLNRLRYQLRKLVIPATVLDGLELICGHGYNREKVSQLIQAGWGHDPVHPNKHIYVKMALNLMERMAAGKTEATSAGSRKRTWSSTNSDAGSSSSHFGGGERPATGRRLAIKAGTWTVSATNMPGPAAPPWRRRWQISGGRRRRQPLLARLRQTVRPSRRPPLIG
jgi:hypothetical protein